MITKTFFVRTRDVSALRVREELINRNLYLFARPLDQFYTHSYFLNLSTRDDYGSPFVAKFRK